MCAVLVRMGIPAHLVSDSGTNRFSELVSKFEPDIVALLSDRLDADDLPTSVRSVVTVGAGNLSRKASRFWIYTFAMSSESLAARATKWRVQVGS